MAAASRAAPGSPQARRSSGSPKATRSPGVPLTAEEAPSLEQRPACCSLYHRAVELIGKRWSGAIALVLLDGPVHFSGIKQLVPELSDRLLSERLKELEAEGIVERRVVEGSPVRVEYGLTEKGRALEPALRALKRWANDWLEAGARPRG